MESTVAGGKLFDEPEPVLGMGQMNRFTAIRNRNGIAIITTTDSGATEKINYILLFRHQHFFQFRC